MPTHIRAMCQFQVHTALPRDVMQITPCFRHQDVLPVGGGADWDDLADDLATALDGWLQETVATQVTVKLYQIGQPKPNRPKATVVKRAGTYGGGDHPRELAICLSFNGGPNAPANRGRLYVPNLLVDPFAPKMRPPESARLQVADLVPMFSGLGGVNVDWIVWSPTRQLATKVERYFVDDEYDVQRRRGLKPNVRTAGTTGG